MERKIIKSDIKVLVVEDNAINIKVFKLLLHECGIKHITIAENGKEAFEVFASEKFDLIFMDINLPDMSGIEISRKMREILQEKFLPIIACTANDTCEKKCLEAGMNNFMVKPITIESIRAMINLHF